MHILQIGLPKSGNFWLYTIINNILEQAKIENKTFIQKQPIYEIAKTWGMSVRKQIEIDFLDITHDSLFYRIGNIFRYPVDDIDDYLNNSTFVWTHSQFSPKVLSVLPKFDKVIYILRDPRDISISWSNFVFTPYMRRYYPFLTANEINPSQYLINNFTTIVSDWVNHLSGYLKNKEKLRIHFICYERLIECYDSEMEKLLKYLEIELDQKSQKDIKEKVDFASMKKDNPNHLRKGSSRQWVEILTENQKEHVLQMASPLLKLLNYPLNDRVYTIPSVPVKFEESGLTASGKVVLLIPAPH